MNKITTFLSIIITTLCFMLVAQMQGKAQNKTFANVIPFVTNNDRLGFFNQSNGKIFIYDNNFSQCLYVGQIQELGQSIQSISAKNMNITNPAAL